MAILIIPLVVQFYIFPEVCNPVVLVCGHL